MYGQKQPNLETPDHSETLRKLAVSEQAALHKRDTLQLAQIYYDTGLTHSFVGDSPKAKTYYLKTIRLLEPRGDSYLLGMTYCRMGGGSLPEEKNYPYLAYEMFQRMKSSQGLIYASKLIGGKIRDRGLEGPVGKMNFDSAYYYYRESERHARQIGDSLNMADIHIHFGMLYDRINPERAVESYKTALALFRKVSGIGGDFGQAHSLIKLAAAYVRINQPAQALKTITEALRYYEAKKLNDFHVLITILETQRDYYKMMGNWQAAYENEEKLSELRKGEYLATHNAEIAKLYVEYESEKRNAEIKTQRQVIALNKQTLAAQRRFIAVSTGLLIIVIVAAIILYRMYARNKRISELNAHLLQEQSHRIKNHLQMVSSLLNMQSRRLSDIDAREAVKGSELQVQSIALLQRHLYQHQAISEIDLSEFVTDLVWLVMRSCGHNNTPVKFRLDEVRIAVDKALPLGLVITELVTNACKYAFNNHPRPRLSVDILRTGNRLSMEIADNGPGLARWEIDRPTDGGFGMQLIRMQVEQLYGTCEFSADESGTGTRFKMEFII